VSTATCGPGEAAAWEAYLAMGEDVRAEYIDGRVVVSPSPTREHQVACSRLVRALEARLPEGYQVISAWAWKPDTNEFIPDVMVHPTTAESVRFTGTPALVIEVLSTNRGDDLVVKLNRYAQAGLPHYWILDPANRVLLAYGLTGEVYDLLTVADEHEPRDVGYGIAEARIDVRSLLS
jgi:Uma2 family endonuclease